VRLFRVGELTGHEFTVIVAFDEVGRLVLCRHKDRSTWETPGGHIEPGESAEEAAKRELLEETGIVPRGLTAVADYDVDGVAGRLFTAGVHTRSPLPAFEIAETIDSDELPDDLTYPEITPILLTAVTEWRSRHRQATPQRSPQ
jgi:8-oxo-dGTP diphosphatase